MNIQKIGNVLIGGLEGATKGAKKITSAVSNVAHEVGSKRKIQKETLTAIKEAEKAMKAMDAQALTQQVQVTIANKGKKIANGTETNNLKKLAIECARNNDVTAQEALKNAKLSQLAGVNPEGYVSKSARESAKAIEEESLKTSLEKGKKLKEQARIKYLRETYSKKLDAKHSEEAKEILTKMEENELWNKLWKREEEVAKLHNMFE